MSKIFPVLLLFLLCTGCKNNITDADLEKQILYDLFPAIVDATCIDIRKYGNPPPVNNRLRIDEDGYPVITDSLALTTEELKKLALWKSEIDSINADTTKLLIRFDPILKIIEDEDVAYAKRFFPDTALSIQKKETFSLPLKKDWVEGRFRITDAVNDNIENRLSLSRILFNEPKTIGIIDVGFKCKGNCGKGYLVLIKKGANGKWFISRVKQTWIA